MTALTGTAPARLPDTANLLVDFAVIGAGIAGASLAWRLAAHGSLAVLEQEHLPGVHTTGRSAAMFMENYGPPGVLALTRASRHFYESAGDSFSDTPILTPRGALYVARLHEAELLDQSQRATALHLPDVKRLSPREIKEMVESMRTELLCGAIYEPHAQDIDVNALHQGYLRGLIRRGGQILNQSPLLAGRWDGRLWTLEMTHGRSMRARFLVNAAGAWADHVAARCGISTIGLVPMRRTAFTFAGPSQAPWREWPVVIAVDESYYFKPTGGSLLGSPANCDPVEPHDVMAEELDVAMGIDRIERATTIKIRRPASVWAGLRSFVADGELVIGPEPSCPTFFWLAAQGGYGIQSAAAAAELAESLLLFEEIPGSLVSHGVTCQATHISRLRH